MNSIRVKALLEELEQITRFVDAQLEQYRCDEDSQMLIEVAVEEVFNNIASYAYGEDTTGEVEILCEVQDEPPTVVIQFVDSGVPFNPLEAAAPDLTEEGLEENEGGLGIHMVKTYMDEVDYCYKDGKNVLILRKKLDGEQEYE